MILQVQIAYLHFQVLSQECQRVKVPLREPMFATVGGWQAAVTWFGALGILGLSFLCQVSRVMVQSLAKAVVVQCLKRLVCMQVAPVQAR